MKNLYFIFQLKSLVSPEVGLFSEFHLIQTMKKLHCESPSKSFVIFFSV